MSPMCSESQCGQNLNVPNVLMNVPNVLKVLISLKLNVPNVSNVLRVPMWLKFECAIVLMNLPNVLKVPIFQI